MTQIPLLLLGLQLAAPAMGDAIATLLEDLARLQSPGAPTVILSPDHELLRPGPLEPQAFQARGWRVIPWTVNDPARLAALAALGVDGLISDYPDRLGALAASRRAAGTNAPLDLQGHRGSRGLRPENTLPAFEAALDLGVTTLEADLGLSADSVLLLAHDPQLPTERCRPAGLVPESAAAPGEPGGWPRTPGGPHRDYGPLIARSAYTALARLACDRLLARFPEQRNDRVLSPVAVAFARAHQLADVYAPPSAYQLFAFVAFYERYYRAPERPAVPQLALERTAAPASSALDAARQARAETARVVRFNLETKLAEPHTRSPEDFVDALAVLLSDPARRARVTVQSFDLRPLRLLARRLPDLQLALLVEAESLAAVR